MTTVYPLASAATAQRPSLNTAAATQPYGSFLLDSPLMLSAPQRSVLFILSYPKAVIACVVALSLVCAGVLALIGQPEITRVSDRDVSHLEAFGSDVSSGLFLMAASTYRLPKRLHVASVHTFLSSSVLCGWSIHIVLCSFIH